jgi:hypothetical protein
LPYILWRMLPNGYWNWIGGGHPILGKATSIGREQVTDGVITGSRGGIGMGDVQPIESVS